MNTGTHKLDRVLHLDHDSDGRREDALTNMAARRAGASHCCMVTPLYMSTQNIASKTLLADPPETTSLTE